MTADKARELLRLAGLFYYDGTPDNSPDPEEYPDEESRTKIAQTLNMNDTWAWATGWGFYVPDDQLPEVGRLFWRYGYCGVLYWVSEQENKMRSEFHDINRFVDFVRAEEAIAKEVPDSSKRAYHKVSYTLPSEVK